MQRKKIIFDLFGTLLNEDGLYEKFFKKISNKYKLQIDYVDLIKNFYLIQRSYIFKNTKLPFKKIIEQSLKKLISDFDTKDLEILWNSYRDIDFHAKIINKLQNLKPKFELYILSNTDKQILERITSFQNNKRMFKKIFTSDQTKNFKPSNQSYSHICHKLKQKANEITYCTDTSWDFEHASNFGFKTIRISDLENLK